MTRSFLLNIFLLGFGALLFAFGALAHEIRPSIADFKDLGGQRFEIKIQANAEALLSGIGSEHEDTDEAENKSDYDKLRALPSGELSSQFEKFSDEFLNAVGIRFDGVSATALSSQIAIPEVGDISLARDSVIEITGRLPQSATTFSWTWPQAFGASVIRMNTSGEDEGYSAYLPAGETSEAIALDNVEPRGKSEIAWEYLKIGFTHIIPKGLDHILFVVGLFLLSTKLSTLLWQITAFTLAHTVTLALGILGYISISPAIVEPLIAASIVYVAVENIMTDKLHRWRPVIVFGFGLLHGLGFAGVLEEIGLSSSNFVTGLIAFNVGVEMGQLTVIAICFLTIGFWFGKKPWYRQLITTPASIGIAVIASWWVVERVFLG